MAIDDPGCITFRQYHYLVSLYMKAGRNLDRSHIENMTTAGARNSIAYLLEEIKWKQSQPADIEKHIMEILADEGVEVGQRVNRIVEFCLMLRRR